MAVWNALQNNKSIKKQLERMEPGTVMELPRENPLSKRGRTLGWRMTWEKQENLKRSQISPGKYWVKSQEVWVGPGTRETHSQPAVSPSSQETWGLRDSISISRGLFEQICGFSFLSLMELSTYVWPRNFMGSDQPCLTETELFNIKALQLPLVRCIKLIRHLNL